METANSLGWQMSALAAEEVIKRICKERQAEPGFIDHLMRIIDQVSKEGESTTMPDGVKYEHQVSALKQAFRFLHDIKKQSVLGI